MTTRLVNENTATAGVKREATDESLGSDSATRGGETARLEPKEKRSSQVTFVRVRAAKDGEVRSSVASIADLTSPGGSDFISEIVPRSAFTRQ